MTPKKKIKVNSVGSKIASYDSRFDSHDSRFDSLDSKIDSVEKRLDSKIDKVLASVHRTQALMEEQRSENKIVLDGLKNVMERQDRVDDELIDFRRTMQIFIKAHSSV